MPLVSPLAQTHVGLYVADFDRSVAYLRRALGFEVRHDTGPDTENRIVIGLIAGLAIELVARPAELVPLPVDADGLGLANVSFSVQSIEDAHAALASEGLANMGPPVTSSSGVRILLMRDPDENLIELIELGGPRTVAELLG